MRWGLGCRSAGLQYPRSHTAATDLKPATSARRGFLLLLSGAVSCCCLSRRCCSRRARAASNLAAHRCSHLLSRSRGILLITQKLRARAPPSLRPQRAPRPKGPAGRGGRVDCGRMAGLNRAAVGAYSKDVRAATNFHGSEKSRIWVGGRYSVARWRNGSNQGLHYRV
jgi:hypothetical protein